MTVPENLHQAIKERYNAEDVKVISDSPRGVDEVYAYGMLPNTTIMGWFPLGDLDELERTLRDTGEIYSDRLPSPRELHQEGVGLVRLRSFGIRSNDPAKESKSSAVHHILQ